MVETTNQQMMTNARKELVYLWIITDRDYSQLRKVEGCEMLGDLNATKTDSVHILEFAKAMGVTEDRIFRNQAANIE